MTLSNEDDGTSPGLGQSNEVGRPSSEESAADRRAVRNEALIEALGGGATHQAAADMVGVSAKTVQRSMADPEFQARVTARRRERLEAVTEALVQASEVAISALVEVAQGGSPRERVTAAVHLLTLGRRCSSADRVEGHILDRLDALETSNGEQEAP